MQCVQGSNLYLENGKLIFNPEICEDCYYEALSWDIETHETKLLEQYGVKYNNINYMTPGNKFIFHPNKRLCKDPAKERLYKRRKGDKFTTGHFFSKESYSEKKITKKRFRRKMKQNLLKEEFYNYRPRDYRTYGWETW